MHLLLLYPISRKLASSHTSNCYADADADAEKGLGSSWGKSATLPICHGRPLFPFEDEEDQIPTPPFHCSPFPESLVDDEGEMKPSEPSSPTVV